VSSLLAVAVAVAAIQNVTVGPEAGDPVRLSCPVGHTTRIVLPEALLRLKAPGLNAALDLTVERTRPEGVLVVTPRAHPVQATLDVRGATRGLRIVIESTASGDGGEIRLAFAGAADPAPTAAVPLPASAATKVETLAPTRPPAAAADGLDPLELLRAKVVVVAEREGLPGQPAMVLTDALQGERWVWLRFLLEGGASSRVARVSWEGGEVDNFTQEPQDKDLRIIVRLERPAITRRAHVTLQMKEGASYTFAMGSRPLKELLP
jgi:hypothetical protein